MGPRWGLNAFSDHMRSGDPACWHSTSSFRTTRNERCMQAGKVLRQLIFAMMLWHFLIYWHASKPTGGLQVR